MLQQQFFTGVASKLAKKQQSRINQECNNQPRMRAPGQAYALLLTVCAPPIQGEQQQQPLNDTKQTMLELPIFFKL